MGDDRLLQQIVADLAAELGRIKLSAPDVLSARV